MSAHLPKLTSMAILMFLLSLALLVRAKGRAEDKEKTPRSQSIYGITNPTPELQSKAPVQRFGATIELRPEMEAEYRKLHAEVWPEVLAAIKKANIQNYTIYIAPIGGKKYLFSYLEYTGDDLEKDFALLGEDPTTRDRWWPLTEACQTRLPGAPEGEDWQPLEMVMHIK